MRFTSHWHLLTLLALAQSLLVLLGVVYLFNWFETSQTATLRHSSMMMTDASASQIQCSLRCRANDSDLQTGQKPLSVTDRFRKASSYFESVGDRFACFIDASSGDTLYHRNRPERLADIQLGSAPFLSIDNPKDTSSLVEYFSNHPGAHSISGMFLIDNQQWLGSAHRLRLQNALVVVMQNESARMAQRAVVFERKRTQTLVWALAISFLVLTLPIIGLHHHDDQLRATNDDLVRQATHNERELMRTRNAVIFGLAKLAESRDNDTGEHLDRIRNYVEILSGDLAQRFADIDDQFTKNISLASSLHDIGKVGIPDSILLKPGRLTPEERGVMQIHTVIGGECLDAIHARLGNNPFMHMARQIAYYHHERWDGNGYPHQLKEDDIPLVARIVAVADVYDALTSKRPYKRAMSHDESRAIILSGSGSQFDPEVVAAFMRHEHEFEAISLRQQSLTDEQATSRFVKLHQMAKASSDEHEKRDVKLTS